MPAARAGGGPRCAASPLLRCSRRFARSEARWYRPPMPCVVVRYHEIALKGGNRPRFVSRLVSNLREATAGLGVRRAESLPGRIVLWLADGADVDEIRERV